MKRVLSAASNGKNPVLEGGDIQTNPPPQNHKPNIFYPSFSLGSDGTCRVDYVQESCSTAMQLVNAHAASVKNGRPGFYGDYLIIDHQGWDGKTLYQNSRFIGINVTSEPQKTSQTPTPAPPCSEQDFNFSDGSGNYSVGDLSAIAQTAVGEASNAFYANEVEAVIGTIVNRQNLNIAAYPQRGSFARGQALIATPGNLRGGVLGEYDAHRFGSGTTKLNGAQVSGVLPASSYVCDQLKAAKDFAVRAGNMSPTDMRALYPYTSNRGIGARLPAGATGVTTIGNTRFFVDAGIRWPF